MSKDESGIDIAFVISSGVTVSKEGILDEVLKIIGKLASILKKNKILEISCRNMKIGVMMNQWILQ